MSQQVMEEQETVAKRVTDQDVLRALVVGVRAGHAVSVASARSVISSIAQAPPESLAEFLEVLLDGGVFTDEEVES